MIHSQHASFDVSEGVCFRRPPTGPFFRHFWLFGDRVRTNLCPRTLFTRSTHLKPCQKLRFRSNITFFSATLPALIAKIWSLFKRFARKTAKKVVSVNTVKFLTFQTLIKCSQIPLFSSIFGSVKCWQNSPKIRPTKLAETKKSFLNHPRLVSATGPRK